MTGLHDYTCLKSPCVTDEQHQQPNKAIILLTVMNV